MIPYMNVYSTDMPVESSDSWTVYLNNTKVRSDAEPILYNNGELMMLSSNLVNWFGAALEQHGNTYSAEREDGRYISFVSGTSEINVNGKIQKTSNTVVPYQGTYPLISAYSAYYHRIHETQCFQGFAQCSPLDADLFMFRYFCQQQCAAGRYSILCSFLGKIIFKCTQFHKTPLSLMKN